MAMRFFSGLLMVLCLSAAAEQATPDPEQWYREGYAPLWAAHPEQRLDEILGYYVDMIETHQPDGSVVRKDKHEWILIMNQWLADGWVSSDLSGLKADRINEHTVTFKARWVDHYKNAEDETSCGWYLAKLRNGQWLFTTYADLDCSAQEF